MTPFNKCHGCGVCRNYEVVQCACGALTISLGLEDSRPQDYFSYRVFVVETFSRGSVLKWIGRSDWELQELSAG
jgi:hypothetical protein